VKLPPVKIRARQEVKIKGWKLATSSLVKIWASIEKDAGNIQSQAIKVQLICRQYSVYYPLLPYMQKTCDVAEKAILAKKKLRKKCVNRDKM